jgi:hypothetical protein
VGLGSFGNTQLLAVCSWVGGRYVVGRQETGGVRKWDLVRSEIGKA